jgi:uncharacterized protein involved in type VI secretion and phage assembly
MSIETDSLQAKRWYGVYPALVSDIGDPDGLGRVMVRLDSGGARHEVWARLATMMAGNNRGSWFVPDVGDEVLLAFEAGDLLQPFVVGALWNGVDRPPESMDAAGANYKKVLRSRNGVKITLDDKDGQEKLVLETPRGEKITLDDDAGAVEVVDGNGNSIKLDGSGITVTSSTVVTVNASQVAIHAGMVTVGAALCTFSGVVQAETLIANSVVSAP